MMRAGRESSSRSKSNSSTASAVREKRLKLMPPSATVAPIGNGRAVVMGVESGYRRGRASLFGGEFLPGAVEQFLLFRGHFGIAQIEVLDGVRDDVGDD